MRKILFILSIIFLTTSCHMNYKKGKVYEFKTNSDTSDELLYWYLITMSDGNSYYYQSNTPVSNFSGVNWTAGKPAELENVDPEAEVEVDPEQLPAEMQAEVETSIDAEATEAASESSDTSSDAGSDSGSDGGGDGGGGE